MKTKTKDTKKFDTVKTFREIKTQISKEISGMDYKELKTYLKKKKSKISGKK